jgi:hypothetical protein
MSRSFCTMALLAVVFAAMPTTADLRIGIIQSEAAAEYRPKCDDLFGEAGTEEWQQRVQAANIYLASPQQQLHQGAIAARLWCDRKERVRQINPRCRVTRCVQRGDCNVCWVIGTADNPYLVFASTTGCRRWTCSVLKKP